MDATASGSKSTEYRESSSDKYRSSLLISDPRDSKSPSYLTVEVGAVVVTTQDGAFVGAATIGAALAAALAAPPPLLLSSA
jgi:hypothetical protein